MTLNGGGKLGFIQDAFAGPGNSPIIAGVFHVTSIGGKGTARVRLVEVSPTTGAILKVFAHHAIRYHDVYQEDNAVYTCQVNASDATGRHMLAHCPRFGVISNGTFTPLRDSYDYLAAAW